MIDKSIEKPVETTKQYGSPEKVLPKPEVTDTHKVSEVPKKNGNGKKLITQRADYVPWFAGPMIFGIVVLYYIIMAITDTPVNFIRELGSITISFIGAVICIYHHYTKNV